MGNRVLLFSVDSIPESGRHPHPIRALSEWNGGASLVQDLLVSGAPQRCQSVIWPEHRIGIVGDYDTGVQRLWTFLDALGKLGSLPEDQDFQEAVQQARGVLSSPEHRGRYMLLEAGEIFGGSMDALETEAENYVNESIPAVVRGAETLIARAPLPPWLARLPDSWREELGLYWTDVLYYTPAVR